MSVYVLHSEDGAQRGGGVIDLAPKECGTRYTSRFDHVFLLAGRSDGDGRVCLCGQFRRRVMKECPTCHYMHVAFAEPVSVTGAPSAHAEGAASLMFTAALEAEQRRIREQQHALAVRGAHIDAALLRARQGVDECIVRAMLESKGIIILCNPPAHAETRP